MNKLLANLICAFVPFKELRHTIRAENGMNNKIIIIENGKEYTKPFYKVIKGLKLNTKGNNNTIILELPFSKNLKTAINISSNGNNNIVKIGKNYCGSLVIGQIGDNNYFEIGSNCSNSGKLDILSVSNVIKIGNECMIADNIEILCDGHAVLDAKTKECINMPNTPLLVGNHVWLGRKCVLLKGTQIPDNCIVATRSVVTKKFDEPNCVIGGQPAKVVKTGIDWAGPTPIDYINQQNNKYNLNIVNDKGVGE